MYISLWARIHPNVNNYSVSFQEAPPQPYPRIKIVSLYIYSWQGLKRIWKITFVCFFSLSKRNARSMQGAKIIRITQKSPSNIIIKMLKSRRVIFIFLQFPRTGLMKISSYDERAYFLILYVDKCQWFCITKRRK